MKRTALIAILSLFLVPQAFAGPWIKSLSVAQKKAKEKNQLIFVDLFADWCGWCHKMEQEVFPSQVFQNATDNMILLRLNTEDGGEGTKLSRQFQVSSLPTFLVLSPDMLLAGMIHGYSPAGEFAKSLTDTATRYQAFLKQVAEESKIGNDYKKRFDLAKAYRLRAGYPQSEARFKKLVSEKGVPADIRDKSFYELSITQMEQKKYTDSLDTLKKFSTVQNKGEPYEQSRLVAAQIYAEQGNYLGAVTELRNFKKNFPSSTLIKNVDQWLPQMEQQLNAPH